MFKFLKKIFRGTDAETTPAEDGPTPSPDANLAAPTAGLDTDVAVVEEEPAREELPTETTERPQDGVPEPEAPAFEPTTSALESAEAEPASVFPIEPADTVEPVESIEPSLHVPRETAGTVRPRPSSESEPRELESTDQAAHETPTDTVRTTTPEPEPEPEPEPAMFVPPAAPPSTAVPVAPLAPPAAAATPATRRSGSSLIGSALVTPLDIPLPSAEPHTRERWTTRLRAGLKKTGSGLTGVFTGAQITEELYEDLESALLLADTGVPATQFLLDDVRRRVKAGGATHPIAVRNALVESLTVLLRPLEKELVIGEFAPTVIMVAGVNGAGKTTSIGKLTKHLSSAGAAVLLAAADTFRAAAREQLTVWADRNTVDIVSQEGGDPAAVSFDAVTAGKARGKDVVLVDTAGRLPTQLHLMEELRKIKRVVQKADPSAPHEVLLVIDGNTGQNALAQVKAFDAALTLTGLIVTKLDGTAKGGVLAAIAQWGTERARKTPGAAVVPVYFIGVGEKLEDLETFNAREFAQALLT